MDNLKFDGDSTLAYLQSVEGRIKDAALSGAQEGGEILRDGIAALAPVRSGRLKAGIEAGLTVQTTANGAVAIIESDVPYDPYVDAKSQYYERGLAAAVPKVREVVAQELSNALNR